MAELIIAGAGLMAAGHLQGGRAAEKEGQAAYKMGLYNQQVQEREARAIEQKTAFESLQQARRGRRAVGKARAYAATRGAVTGEGAAADIVDEQYAEMELENMLIGYEGRMQAGRARQKGKLDVYRGRMAKRRGRQAKKASYIKAGATLLTGFGAAHMYGAGGTGQLTPGGKATFISSPH